MILKQERVNSQISIQLQLDDIVHQVVLVRENETYKLWEGTVALDARQRYTLLTKVCETMALVLQSEKGSDLTN